MNAVYFPCGSAQKGKAACCNWLQLRAAPGARWRTTCRCTASAATWTSWSRGRRRRCGRPARLRPRCRSSWWPRRAATACSRTTPSLRCTSRRAPTLPYTLGSSAPAAASPGMMRRRCPCCPSAPSRVLVCIARRPPAHTLSLPRCAARRMLCPWRPPGPAAGPHPLRAVLRPAPRFSSPLRSAAHVALPPRVPHMW